MTTKKVKTPTKHPKMVNEYMVYEGLNQINCVFGALVALEVYINSDKFSKYHAILALDCLRHTLIEGTEHLEKWCEIDEGFKNDTN